MSDIKVSEMPEASELNNNDLLMIVQNGVNKKVKTEKIGIAELQTDLEQQITGLETSLGQQIVQTKTDLEEKINGTVLYEDETGSTGQTPITLTESLSNYEEYEIEYALHTTDGTISQSTGRISTSRPLTILTMWRPTTDVIQFITQLMKFNNDTLQFQKAWNFNVQNLQWQMPVNNVQIMLQIVKVKAYNKKGGEINEIYNNK